MGDGCDAARLRASMYAWLKTVATASMINDLSEIIQRIVDAQSAEEFAPQALRYVVGADASDRPGGTSSGSAVRRRLNVAATSQAVF